MMPKFSRRSLDRLATCDQRLQDVMNEAIKDYDFMVLEGHRSPERQKELFEAGFSKTLKSKHVAVPSLAVDIAPYPLDWKDIERFKVMAQVVKNAAKRLYIKIEWGGDWKSFKDCPHFQLPN